MVEQPPKLKKVNFCQIKFNLMIELFLLPSPLIWIVVHLESFKAEFGGKVTLFYL